MSVYCTLEYSQDRNTYGFQRNVVIIENWGVLEPGKISNTQGWKLCKGFTVKAFSWLHSFPFLQRNFAFLRTSGTKVQGKVQTAHNFIKVPKNEARYMSIKSLLLNSF
jgi:hypothetical protein